MPFINPIQYWYIILILVLIQLGIMLSWGWTLRKIVKNKYSNSSYQLFQHDNYCPLSDYKIPEYPQYDVVLVTLNIDGTVQSETFYTKLGDWIYFEYKNGQKVKTNIVLISSWLLIIFGCFGVLMGIIFSLINIFSNFFQIYKFLLQDCLKITKIGFSLLMYSTGITLYVKPFFEK